MDSTNTFEAGYKDAIHVPGDGPHGRINRLVLYILEGCGTPFCEGVIACDLKRLEGEREPDLG